MNEIKLKNLVRLAYSAERAACYAYQGHAASVRDSAISLEIRRIEKEEWDHREYLSEFMESLEIKKSKWLEFKYKVIGKIIGYSCFVIGKFMPNYFAGRLESGNVNEYIEMARLAKGSVIEGRIGCIMEMALVEKRHEMYFLDKVSSHPMRPLFQYFFKWGIGKTFNPLDESYDITKIA